ARPLPRVPGRGAPGLAPPGRRRRPRRGRRRGGGRARPRGPRPPPHARAAERLPADLIAALRPHAAWTSAATHAVLPLLATDAGVRLQVRTGIAAHRARFGDWDGGLWLPEGAHAPWLDGMLGDEGGGAPRV